VDDPAFQQEILDQMYDGVYFVDTAMTIRYWNHGAQRISGFSQDEVLGSRCADNILTHVTEEGTRLCGVGCPLSKTISDGEPREAEFYLHHKHGHRIPVLVRTAPLRDGSGAIVGGVEVFSDNRARVALQEEIEELTRLALLDQLTEIGNRRYAEMTIHSRRAELERYGSPYGVLMIDVDYFKAFNDRHGHDVGDTVLRMVAQTLNANVRSFDVAARWGGEEFVVIMEKVSLEDLSSRASKLCQLVEASSLTARDARLSVTVSIGGTIARPGESEEATVRRADRLLYRSKSEGRNRATCE
jgi:diguanylate cyclase (GGDEF)-like protein/PAS domain S-box-containing protein